MKQFKQLYSIDRNNLTKKELLLEIGFDHSNADYIARRLKKDVIYHAWMKAYHEGSNYNAVRLIKKELKK